MEVVPKESEIQLFKFQTELTYFYPPAAVPSQLIDFFVMTRSIDLLIWNVF